MIMHMNNAMNSTDADISIKKWNIEHRLYENLMYSVQDKINTYWIKNIREK